jgi:hypothetical protein
MMVQSYEIICYDGSRECIKYFRWCSKERMNYCNKKKGGQSDAGHTLPKVFFLTIVYFS